ncbi:hypothetical protein [Flavobacterium sp. JP2137]|uniref:hypothetical protein n=1 Tax=Flavobacterium sp. JP2137 TaxID=3414510 RepID=UPI003D3003AA
MVRKLKIILALIILGGVIYFIINVLKSDGIRIFYCLSDRECITVWKKTNGEVYIIPEKYEDNNEPRVSHIKTTNKQFLTLYFSKELPMKIIIRDEGNLGSNQKGYAIENKVKGEWELLEYSDRYKNILYKSDAIKFKDVKSTTKYLIINIEENYALDKDGKKLK